MGFALSTAQKVYLWNLHLTSDVYDLSKLSGYASQWYWILMTHPYRYRWRSLKHPRSWRTLAYLPECLGGTPHQFWLEGCSGTYTRVISAGKEGTKRIPKVGSLGDQHFFVDAS